MSKDNIISRDDHFTYVVTFTISDENVQKAFKGTIEDVLKAKYIDQSTYGTNDARIPDEMCKFLYQLIQNLYKENKITSKTDDVINLLYNPNRAYKSESIQYPKEIYLCKIK